MKGWERNGVEGIVVTPKPDFRVSLAGRTFSCTLLTQNHSIIPSSLFIWVNIPHVLSCQALIHQWEYQPIRRRVEKGAYYHLLNQADDKNNCLAGQPDLKPRVIAHRARALLCTYPRSTMQRCAGWACTKCWQAEADGIVWQS